MMSKHHRRAAGPLFFLLALACGDPPPPVVEPSPPPAPPTLVETPFTLENGLAVELVSGPCAGSVAVVLAHAAGTDHDPLGRSGLTRVLLEILKARAGSDRAIVLGRDLILESFTVPVAELPSALDAAATRMTTLGATEQELALARSNVLAQLAARRGGDAALTAASFATESMRPARGGGWTFGVEDEIRGVALSELEAFAAGALGASATRLVIVGGFDPAEVRPRIESAFASLARVTPPPPRDPNEASVAGTLVFGDAPAALAIAVRAPEPTDPLYPAFALLASRLLRAPSAPRSWTVRHDPIADPELLYVEAGRDVSETPDAAAVRVRNEMMGLLAGEPTEADVAAAREHFGALLGDGLLSPERCAASPLELALARARRSRLGLSGDLSGALASVSAGQLDEVRPRFSAERSAATVAGGTL